MKHFNWHWLIAIVAIIIFTMAAKSLYHMAHTIDMAQIRAVITGMPIATLLMAVGVTVAAYLLLSVYDLIAARYLGIKLSYPRILNTSFTAFSLGHTLGVAMLSAGAVRFRYYGLAGVKNEQIANIILLISLAFSYGTMTVIGISLVVNPHMLSQLLTHVPWLSALSPLWFRVIGTVILAIILASYIFAGKLGREFSVKQWRLRLPPAFILIKLSVVAVIDIGLVVYLIHVLLPSTVQVSYLETYSAFVQAMTVGIISHVPGGLGVFELTMVASLPQVDKATLLSVLLLYRILYYLCPFALGVLSFFLHEAYLRSKVVTQETLTQGTATQETTARKRLLPKVWIPQLLGLMTSGLGVSMLVLSILPPNKDRELLLQEFFPVSVLETSYLLNTLMGFLLMILARGLYQRLNGAWHITMWLLGLSVATLLFKGLELEIVVICSVVFALLYFYRGYFNRQSTLMSLRLNTQSLVLFSIFFISLFWIGMFVFRHEAYTPDLWWQVSGDEGARFLRSFALLAILTISFTLFSLIRFKKLPPSLPTQDELTQAWQVIQQSPYSIANLSMLGDKQLLFSESKNSFIMYQIHGRSWIVMSDPIGDTDEFAELIHQFIELCYSFGGTFVFYEVSNAYRSIFLRHDIQLLKIGEEAIVDLDNFSLQGSKQSKFRQIVNRGTRDGLVFEVISSSQVPAIISELKAISDIWLADKHSAEKGFSLGYFDEDYLKRFDCALVRYEGEIVAFANIWQSGLQQEASIDLMRYKNVNDAEGKEVKNLMDFLFINLFMWAKESGFHHFSLGMAPFTGLDSQSDKVVSDDSNLQPSDAQTSVANGEEDIEVIGAKWRYVTNNVTKYGKRYYNFTGLRQFKEKYNPVWESRYIGIRTGLKAGVSPIRGLADTTLLISGKVDKSMIFKRR